MSAYLVFGDLHGRILPAFRLAMVWLRERGETLDGILQVGDLGYFPNPGKLDKATRRHAEGDSLELGAQLVAEPSPEADKVFSDATEATVLWFTAGNHEDFDELEHWQSGADSQAASFAVDAYSRVRCLRDGRVETIRGSLRVAALWRIDTQAPRARRKIEPAARINPRSAAHLAATTFDVLLTHESPRDAVLAGAGSEDISTLIHLAQPSFAFFGHYGSASGPVGGSYGRTQVYHLAGFELRERGGYAEEQSVGVLRWHSGTGSFEFLDPAWLRSFTRHNWKYR